VHVYIEYVCFTFALCVLFRVNGALASLIFNLPSRWGTNPV